MTSHLKSALSSILDNIHDMDYQYKHLDAIDNVVEELHVIRNNDGKAVALRVVTRYDRGY